MYETGLDYIRELNKLGANIFMADPQKVIVTGPVNFKGGEIVLRGIIQACMAIFLASLQIRLKHYPWSRCFKKNILTYSIIYKSLGRR